MKTRLIAMPLLALTLILPSLAPAADREEPTVYVIKQGDTLWGLSDRFMKDPAYWPDLWAKNGQITNPHFMYPGQRIRVSAGGLEPMPRQEPAGKKGATVASATEPLTGTTEERAFVIRGNEGYLLEKDAKPFGSIIGIHHDHVVGGVDDMVYTDIGAANGARGGEEFSIFRNEGSVSHPLTNEIMGQKIIPLGSLQLTDIEQTASRAIITRNFKEITPGSYLIPSRGGRYREVALKAASRELTGYIIESSSGTTVIAAGDIIYLDLGSTQGAEPGNMLYIVRDVTQDQRYAEGRFERLPQELLGALVILETGRNTSTALIVKSIDAIYKGDRIVSHTK